MTLNYEQNAKSVLQGLSAEIRANATSQKDIGLSNLISACVAIDSKVKFANPLHTYLDGRYQNLEIASISFIVNICSRGNIAQRRVIADNIDFFASLCVPSINYNDSDKSVLEMKKWLKFLLDECCEAMGVNFKGSAEMFIDDVFYSYGGLTVIDFVKFFECVRSRKYVDDFQYIQTQGLNATFLFDWLKKYCEEKESVLNPIREYTQFSKNELTGKEEVRTVRQSGFYDRDSIGTSEKAKELLMNLSKKELRLSEMKQEAAHRNRVEEEKLWETGVVEGEIVRTKKQNANKIILQNFVSNFVSFYDFEKTKSVMTKISRFIESNFIPLGIFTLQEFKSQQAASIAVEAKKAINQLGFDGILNTQLASTYSSDPSVFFEKLGMKVDSNFPPFSKVVSKLRFKFLSDYHQYLEDLLADKDSCPLNEKDFLLQSALMLVEKIKGEGMTIIAI